MYARVFGSVISPSPLLQKQKLLSVSNSIIVYDLIKNASKENVDESQIVGGK